MTLYLSLDFGTGGVRAGVFDTATTRMRATSEVHYATTQPRPGWAEQDPNAWWNALVTAVRRVLDSAGTTDIAAVCVDTTASTVVACTRAGKPLRPAILWMDCRAAAQSQFTETIDHPVMAYSGHGDAVEWLVPKAMWLAQHEPHVYRGAEILCEAVDFINFKLTGEWAGSRLNATCKWNYDAEFDGQGAFFPELFAAFGVPDLLEKLPSRIVAVGEAVGTMRAEIAAELGISGTPLVAQGGIDAHIGVFGAGTVEPGRMLMIAGTSVVHLTHTDHYRDIDGIWGPYPHALVKDLWLIEGGQVSAGSILTWFSDTIFQLDRQGFDALMGEVAAVEPGSTGLLALDYWMGNRTPYRDPDMRGAIMGLSLWHDRASLYRSAVDAIALGSANVIDDLARQDIPVDHLVVAGGICKNPVWLQSAVDAIGLPVHVAADDNLSLVGGAVSAATALGQFADLRAASGAFAVPTAIVEPNPVRKKQYEEMLGHYKEATELIAPISHRLATSSRLRSEQ